MSTESARKPVFVTTVLAAAAVLAASIAGIIDSGIYEGLVVEEFLPGTISQDIVSALSAAGLLICLVVVRRGSRRAWAVWLGLMAYILYAYGLYSFERIYNPFFPAYVAAFGLSLFSIILFFWRGDRRGLPSVSHDRRRGIAIFVGIYLFALAAVFLAVWTSMIVPAVALRIPPPGNAIFVMDLSFFLPLLVIAAVMLLRSKPFGDFLAGALLVMMAALGTSVMLGGLLAPAFGLELDVSMAILFAVLGPGSAVLAALWLARLDERISGGRGVRHRW